ncbi:hypothetical protein [Vibrio rotiferianus]|uniref:hypothetical protein n=1 Tax=Vibrio rotiferianus TaxID=190895 RepID=UPI00406A981D
MSSYQMENDIALVANVGHISISRLKNWCKTAPEKAMLFDTACSAISFQPETYEAVQQQAISLSISNHHEIHRLLGIPNKVERLSGFAVPVNTLRRWMTDNPHTYIAAVIGIQQLIIHQHCDATVSQKLYKKIGLSFSEQCSLFVANADAVGKLIKGLKL